MNAEIENLLDQLTAIQQDAPGLVSPLSPEQCAWRPEPDRWSVGDCFAHLNTTAEATLPILDAAIEQGRTQGLTGSGPFAYSWFDRMMVGSMEPPPRMRTRTTRRFRPPPVPRDPAALLAEFMTWQERLAAVIRRAEGLDLRRIRMRSPVLSWLRYSLGAGFGIVLAHERRHLWQARQIRTAPGFPRVERESSAPSV